MGAVKTAKALRGRTIIAIALADESVLQMSYGSTRSTRGGEAMRVETIGMLR